MGAVRLIYDETTRQLKRLGWWSETTVAGTRKFMSGPLRYCLQANTLYLPEDQSIIDAGHRLCWGRIRVEEFEYYPWLAAGSNSYGEFEEVNFDTELPEDPLALDTGGIGFGLMYSQRHRETPDGRVPVSAFVAEALIGAVADNPEVLINLSKTDFEALTAELFARMGFEVDLLRPSKDDGIDFLAVRNEDTPQPVVLAVQTKHPDAKPGGARRRPLPVATVREIYGVAKAWNLHGAIAVTSSAYTPEAKRFAELRPDEIEVADASDVIRWAKQYRWNNDE